MIVHVVLVDVVVIVIVAVVVVIVTVVVVVDRIAEEGDHLLGTANVIVIVISTIDPKKTETGTGIAKGIVTGIKGSGKGLVIDILVTGIGIDRAGSDLIAVENVTV